MARLGTAGTVAMMGEWWSWEICSAMAGVCANDWSFLSRCTHMGSLENIFVSALCFLKVLSDKCLNWSIVARAHVPRQVPDSDAWWSFMNKVTAGAEGPIAKTVGDQPAAPLSGRREWETLLDTASIREVRPAPPARVQHSFRGWRDLPQSRIHITLHFRKVPT